MNAPESGERSGIWGILLMFLLVAAGGIIISLASMKEVPPKQVVAVPPPLKPAFIPVKAKKKPPKPRKFNPCLVQAVDLLTATSLHGQGTAVFVDAREPSRFREGHIPLAVNVPPSDFRRSVERSRASLPPSARLVIYNEGAGSGDAEGVCEKFAAMGYNDLVFFRNGMLLWSAGGLPVEKSE